MSCVGFQKEHGVLRNVYYMTVEQDLPFSKGWHYRVTMTRSDLRKFQEHPDVLCRLTDMTVLGDGIAPTYEEALQAVHKLMPTSVET